MANIFKSDKMSENLTPSISTAEVSSKKKLINVATQHGNVTNANEENIMVLLISRSPNRETEDEVILHEEKCIIHIEEDVSTEWNFILIILE